VLPTYGLGSPCQLLVTGGLGTCKTNKNAWKPPNLDDFKRFLLRDDNEIVEILLGFFSVKRRLH
jgi:hypothetical protein